MTQQRPSGPSDRHVEYVSGDAVVPAEPGSAVGPGSTPIPHQQSRPGPEDDRLLATGEPARPAVIHAGETRPQAEKRKQEAIRRQPGRKAWVPNQHGAWSMLALPAIVGWVVGGFSWRNLLLLPAWWGAYLAYWAWSQWLRTRSPRRRRLLVPPLVVYSAFTAILGLLTIVTAPYLLQFAVPFAPLLAIALWQVWQGHERSLLSGLSTTAAASLIAAVTYSLAVDGAGGFLGTGADARALPGSSPNGALTGWPWMWLVTALTAAYFCGTVPYIKAMIRERFNNRLLAGTVVAHGVIAAVTVWLAVGGYLPWAHAMLWVALAVRSYVMPTWQWRLVRERHRPLRPGTMGVLEMVFCVAFLLTIATY